MFWFHLFPSAAYGGALRHVPGGMDGIQAKTNQWDVDRLFCCGRTRRSAENEWKARGRIMRIEKTLAGNVVLLKITGAIAFTDVSTLRTTLHRIAREGNKNIIVDCSSMDSMNSLALATFLAAYKAMKDGRVVFAHANPHVVRILHSTHLDDMFPLYTTVEQALDATK